MEAGDGATTVGCGLAVIGVLRFTGVMDIAPHITAHITAHIPGETGTADCLAEPVSAKPLFDAAFALSKSHGSEPMASLAFHLPKTSRTGLLPGLAN